MKRSLQPQWFRDIAISHKLYFTVGLMALLIILELSTLVFSIQSLSSVRAYVGAEGLWSKAQKDAIYYVQKYARTGKEADFQEYLRFLKVPLSDRVARLEMAKENPDYKIIWDGFLNGGVHPDDIDGMVNLFRRFHAISYISDAISVWTEGDALMVEFQKLADKIHNEIMVTGVSSPKSLKNNLKKVDELNAEFTVLEDRFSSTLGEGSRWMENLILKILLAIAITVELIGISLGISVSLAITKGIREIIRVATKINNMDFSERAAVFSKDEIGQLASHFNSTINSLESNIQQLKESETQITTIVENAPDAIITINEESKIINWNPQAETIFGWTKNEAVGKLLTETIIPKKYRELHLKGINKFLKTGEGPILNKPIEMTALRKNNTEFPIELTISPSKINDHHHIFIGFVRDITNRKKAEEDLKLINERFTKIFENNPIGMTVSESASKKIILANTTFYSTFGYEKDEIIGYTPDELNLISPEERARLIPVLLGYLKEKRSIEELQALSPEENAKLTSKLKQVDEMQNFEVEYTHKDGHTFPALVFFDIIKIGDENYTITSYQDITERKKSEEELVNAKAAENLAKKRDLYSRSLIEASLDPKFIINKDGMITDVNKATTEITGVTRKKLIGSNFIDYFTEPDHALKGYRQVFEKEFVIDYPLTTITKKPVDVLFNGSTFKDDKGNVAGAVLVARDLTEQKLHQQELEKSLKEISDYKYTLDESSIVSITNQKGIFTYANKNFCKISKYSIDELLGKHYSIFNSHYHSKEFTDDLASTINNGKIWRGDLRNKAKDGSIFWVDTTIVPFLDDTGKPYQFVAIETDITDRKRVEKELMESKVFADIEKQKAEEAKELAEATVISKQTFLANMSHEIRTPMAAIIGFTNVLLKSDLSEKDKEYLSAIKSSGDSLIVIINDILDLAKVNAGKITFEQSPFNMAVSISSMLFLFKEKANEKGLKLIKEYDNKIPEVLVGDPARLHQILINLLSNSLKFTLTGTISVGIHLLDEDEEKATIEFTVTDTGIGIAEQKLTTIFNSFEQESTTISKVFGGTGLGLAIVKELVERQGGSISVKSKVNKGSTFTFNLSFLKTTEKPEQKTIVATLNPDIKGIKVLVAEDNALNQLLIRTILDDFGFERDIASNGKEAIKKLKSNTYDIILMDIQMPEMNGYEAVEYIRKKMKSSIPIIALTADVTASDVEKCKAVGMNDYAAKPIDEHLLYNKIIELVKK